MAFFLKLREQRDFKANIKKLVYEFPILETERLLLKKIETNNCEDMYEYSKNPNVTKYLTWIPHQSLSQTLNYIKTLQKQYQNGSFFDWGLIYKESGKFIGTCGFTSFDIDENKAEIGYVISENFWGLGLATEAAKKVIEFAFNVLGVSKVEAKFMDGNVLSANVMRKCGMKFESLYRNSMYIKGDYKTIQVYSLCKQDYNNSEINK